MQSIYYKIIKLIGIVTLCDTYDETPQSNNHLSAGIIWKTQSKTGSNYPSFLFGTSHIEKVAAEHGISVIDYLPLDPKMAALCDEGKMEEAPKGLLEKMSSSL